MRPSSRRPKEPDEHNYEVVWYERRPKILMWTSKASLSTAAGTPLFVLRGKRITRVRISVAGAPSGDTLIGDILVDGQSAFSSLDSKPRILAGDLQGRTAYMMGGRSIPFDGKTQCQITTVASATGPAVFEIEYLD